jgi:hypothetical protein
MKHLKNLKVFDEAAPELMKMLVRLTKPPNSHTLGTTNLADAVPFPYLESFMIRGANIILSKKNLSRYGPHTQNYTVTFQDIMEWLQQRSALGAPPIKEILFKDCGGFSSKVKELFEKLRKLFGVENIVQKGCRPEADDLDGTVTALVDSHSGEDSDEGICNACFEFPCEGECEICI